MSDVSVVLVSHDGASWLPAVLEGIVAQTSPVAGVVAVDTGSKDGSADLIESTLDAAGIPVAVLRESSAVSFPRAVALALEGLTAHGIDHEWVWVLHDDSNPAPTALEELLAAAFVRPDASFFGPKLREWPSLKRLLEIGVTISGTGRRETGLERGEYDQGQHDQVREVLAVNSAGLLARRTVLADLGGYDEHLPMFGNDVDLGWRSAAAGHATVVVPRAVVFHAEAAHRGIRRTALTGRHTHYQERRAALLTLLANCRTVALPFQLVRLALGSVLRVLGFLVVRAVGEALDELAALLTVYSRPGPLLAARRERRERQAGPPDHERLRRLLAPWWLPYRHGLDFVADLVAAATNQAADVAERRRIAAAERDPSPPVAQHRTGDDEDDFEDTGLVARFLASPVAVALAITAVAFVVGARDAFSAVSGGSLSPVPDGASDWWHLQYESWHPIGFGSAVPAPPYVLPLALLASLLGTELTMTVLLVAAAPIALWGAWRFLRVVGRLITTYGAPRWLLLWGSVSYALVPLVAGAWGSGRWGVVVASAVLPWLAHAALGFAEPEAPRRWRAAWRVGLLLTLLTAFAPVMWVLFTVLGAVVVATSGLVVRGAVRERSVWGPPATALGVPLLLLAPWWLPSVWEGAAGGVLLDIGRWPTPSTDGLDLLVGRFGDLGAPWWLGLALPVVALLALLPRPTRIGVVLCWLVAGVAAVVAVPLGLTDVDLAGAASQQAGLGPVLLVLHGSWITAAVLGALALTERSPSPVVLPRLAQGVTAIVGLAAAVVPLAGLVWFAGWGGDELSAHPDDGIPVYMEQEAQRAPQNGILVVRGSVAHGVTYAVVRGDGATVGEDEIAALTSEDTSATDLVAGLTTAPSDEAVAELTERGIEYVVQPAPADGEIATRLDATEGLVRASAEDRATRAWLVLRDPDPASVEGHRSWPRILLLVLQGIAVPVVAVLALPTMRRGRS